MISYSLFLIKKLRRRGVCKSYTPLCHYIAYSSFLRPPTGSHLMGHIPTLFYDFVCLLKMCLHLEYTIHTIFYRHVDGRGKNCENRCGKNRKR